MFAELMVKFFKLHSLVRIEHKNDPLEDIDVRFRTKGYHFRYQRWTGDGEEAILIRDSKGALKFYYQEGECTQMFWSHERTFTNALVRVNDDVVIVRQAEFILKKIRLVCGAY